MLDFDVREILDRYGISYKTINGSTDLFYYCPFHVHSDENMGSSRINEETGIYNCFACKEGGSIYRLVSLLEKVSINEAYRLIKNNFNIQSDYNLDKLQQKTVKVVSLKASQVKLVNSIVNKILENLINVGKRDFIHKWLIICTYIKSIVVSDLEKKQNDILNIYSEFNKELKTL